MGECFTLLAKGLVLRLGRRQTLLHRLDFVLYLSAAILHTSSRRG